MINIQHHLDPRFNTSADFHIAKVCDFENQDVINLADTVARAQASAQPFLPVVIYSYGGEAYSAFAMAGILKSCQMPVATIIYGAAMSSAALVFSCGDDGMRFMPENSTVMIHNGSSYFNRLSNQALTTEAGESQRLEDLYFSILNRNTNQELGYFENLIKENKYTNVYLTPEDCIKHNIATNIGTPIFNVYSEVNRTFDFKTV